MYKSETRTPFSVNNITNKGEFIFIEDPSKSVSGEDDRCSINSNLTKRHNDFNNMNVNDNRNRFLVNN